MVQKSQLELYLSEPRMERKKELDVLQFWRGNQCRYPELSSMARDLLAIPVSSVASEAAFSVGGRVINKFRSSLKPANVEALLCTRDWIYGKQCIYGLWIFFLLNVIFLVFFIVFNHYFSFSL